MHSDAQACIGDQEFPLAMQRLDATARSEHASPIVSQDSSGHLKGQLRAAGGRKPLRTSIISHSSENASLEKAKLQEFQKNLLIPNRLVGHRCPGVSFLYQLKTAMLDQAIDRSMSSV